MSPEEQVQAVRAALAEVGWVQGVDVDVEEAEDGEPDLTVDYWVDPLPPGFAEDVWRAFALLIPGTPCWPCWRAAESDDHEEIGSLIDCTHDPFAEPWPPVLTSGEPR